MYLNNPCMIHRYAAWNIVTNSAFNQFYNLTSVLYHKPRKTNFSIIALWGNYMK